MCNADHAVGSIMTDYMRQRILKMHFWQAHLVSIATRNRQVDYMTTFIIISHRIIHYGIQQMHSIILTRHGTGSLGHRINWGHLSRPGHRVIILTRCETRVFPVIEKNAQNAKRTFEMLKWQKSLSGVCCWTEITGCQSTQWTFTSTYDYKKMLWPENTCSHISRHLEFIIL